MYKNDNQRTEQWLTLMDYEKKKHINMEMFHEEKYEKWGSDA